MIISLLTIFESSLHCRKKSIRNPEEILSQKHVFLYKNIGLQFDVIWPDIELTSVNRNAGWRHVVKRPSLSISTCKITQNTCIARHVCDFYFIATFWDLTLIKVWPSTRAVPFLDIFQYREWAWALCSASYRPESPKCEHAAWMHVKTFDLILTWHITSILKC